MSGFTSRFTVVFTGYVSCHCVFVHQNHCSVKVDNTLWNTLNFCCSWLTQLFEDFIYKFDIVLVPVVSSSTCYDNRQFNCSQWRWQRRQLSLSLDLQRYNGLLITMWPKRCHCFIVVREGSLHNLRLRCGLTSSSDTWPPLSTAIGISASHSQQPTADCSSRP